MSASITSGSYHPIGILPALVSSFGRWGRVVWRGLLLIGASRADSHLRALALQYEHTQPELAARLRDSARNLPAMMD